MDVLKLSQNYKKCVREYCKHKESVFISIVKYDTQLQGVNGKNICLMKRISVVWKWVFRYFLTNQSSQYKKTQIPSHECHGGKIRFEFSRYGIHGLEFGFLSLTGLW